MPKFLLLAFLLLAATARAEIKLKDDAGRTLHLARPARRIVSLAPHLTENLYAAGGGGSLVAVGDYSDFPPAARKLPRVGGAGRLDMEALLAIKPDLILAWSGGTLPAQLTQLESLGLPVYLSNPKHMADVAGEIERLGLLAGSLPAAQAAAGAFRARQDKLAARYARRPSVRVFYEIWNRPLMTVNGQHLISDAITLCGGENVFASLPRLTPTVTDEAVLAAKPEAIVASGMDMARPEWLDDWKRWPTLMASDRGNLFHIPPDFMHRATTRILDGAEQLCVQLETVRSRRP
jgi:iron complex transport system substrate-binding protein